MKQTHSIGVSKSIAKYADGVEVQGTGRWLFSAGTPGLDTDGNIPTDFADEAENAWKNVLALLDKAGFSADDLVKVTTTLTSTGDIDTYKEIRERILGEAEAAFMLQVVEQMIRPELRVEIEIVAYKD